MWDDSMQEEFNVLIVEFYECGLRWMEKEWSIYALCPSLIRAGRYLFCGQSSVLVVCVRIEVEWGVSRMRLAVSWSGGVIMLVSPMSLLLLGWFHYVFYGEQMWGKWSAVVLWCRLILMLCLIWFDMACMVPDVWIKINQVDQLRKVFLSIILKLSSC